MRQLLMIIKIGLTIFFLVTLFIWVIAHGSGHNIPFKTELAFSITSIILLILLLFTIYLSRK